MSDALATFLGGGVDRPDGPPDGRDLRFDFEMVMVPLIYRMLLVLEGSERDLGRLRQQLALLEGRAASSAIPVERMAALAMLRDEAIAVIARMNRKIPPGGGPER